MGKRKKKAVRGREEPGHVIISDKRCLKSSRFILFLHSQRCTTWPWASQEASSLECELDHTDSPQTDWLMGCLSLPVKHKKKKKRSNELTASSTSRSRKQLDTYCMENKILTLPPAAPRGWLLRLDGLAWHLAQTFITHPHRMNCSNSGDPSSFVFFYLIISGGIFRLFDQTNGPELNPGRYSERPLHRTSHQGATSINFSILRHHQIII